MYIRSFAPTFSASSLLAVSDALKTQLPSAKSLLEDQKMVFEEDRSTTLPRKVFAICRREQRSFLVVSDELAVQIHCPLEHAVRGLPMVVLDVDEHTLIVCLVKCVDDTSLMCQLSKSNLQLCAH